MIKVVSRIEGLDGLGAALLGSAALRRAREGGRRELQRLAKRVQSGAARRTRKRDKPFSGKPRVEVESAGRGREIAAVIGYGRGDLEPKSRKVLTKALVMSFRGVTRRHQKRTG